MNNPHAAPLPERIELPNGWKMELKPAGGNEWQTWPEHYNLFNPYGVFVAEMSVGIGQAFAAAMQPAPVSDGRE